MKRRQQLKCLFMQICSKVERRQLWETMRSGHDQPPLFYFDDKTSPTAHGKDRFQGFLNR